MNCDNSYMTLWDHLDDLKKVLIKCSAIIACGIFLALLFHSTLINFWTKQFDNVAKDQISMQQVKRYRLYNPTNHPKNFTFNETSLLLQPGETTYYEKIEKPKLLLLSPQEGLIQIFKIAFWVGLTLTSPLWCWVVLTFILPGLNPGERKIVMPFLVFSSFFIISALTFAHFLTIPISNAFLSTFNQQLGQNAWTLANYIDYTIIIYLGHVIAAMLALLLLLSVHFGAIKREKLKKARKHYYVLAFILGALLTPPDVLTQLMLALPLIVIYEIAIIYSFFRSKKLPNS